MGAKAYEDDGSGALYQQQRKCQYLIEAVDVYSFEYSVNILGEEITSEQVYKLVLGGMDES